MSEKRVMHAPGECPEPIYGRDCDGMGYFGPDPFAEEINNDSTPDWACYGVLTGSAMDI